MTQRPWADELAEARQLATQLSESFPPKIEVAALGVLSKAPLQLMVVREALYWRTEELARNACDAFDREDFTVAALLTRSIAESAAMVSYLLEILEQRASYTPAQLNDKLMQILGGSRVWSDGPAAVNVLTFVKRLDVKIPGFHAAYDTLSEYAHPNWRGVSGLYSKIDKANFAVNFGRGFRADLVGRQLVRALVGGLIAFVYGYDAIADLMPVWLAELEKIWPDQGQ